MKIVKNARGVFFGGLGLFLFVFWVTYFVLPTIAQDKYEVGVKSSVEAVKVKPFVATHVSTPNTVKGVYMTSWVAGTPSLRANIVRLLDDTELNSVVIDIKDDTGRVSFEVWNPELKVYGSEDVRITDLRDFIGKLHEKNIYAIGRIASFQDPYMVKKFPDLAVKRASDGGVWRDRKGLTWIDPGDKEQWKYLALLAKESYAAGFDEIQFDYIRFPSDGNMNDISYPHSAGRIKHEVIKDFFAFLSQELKPTGMKISADLFGMTTTNPDDLNIGQVLEDAFLYFDYISPMVYPSHYPTGFHGYKNVNSVPYEIVKISMDSAVARLKTFHNTVASTTVEFRPWLQDNDYPVPYTSEMVRAQIKATYDSGLDSWLLWDAGNTYTRAALLDE
ncbi:MAG: hypothetical protein A2741_00475 [Candidatus Zambryskibacteria bacterium RIFCSPHIGHO2_01_FULL_43_27]|uniref:DUF4015 domain-containing protein n=1 Tax=Candidatus Zambryskibacteria bacterium RIFCSPLOWO2_01_FULL_43_17 TaxID=1802760 RepID=A0A1G2U232_9BACT|nr:MAG: hypothetical protein A2741_00475 [Candidatus Zambryskibacteria bacterium RIFCSPHIGHO2_01_FULL_43_27]OHA99711.1 MAG: hypothetical protein A3E93_00780 [Candidatus Zambryskibacteria bacterium RIFCSPHIGHO2_12_FULL_43_12b]OHB03568.1 MAG: hypothetical protein A2920_02810 [Candidatus Zambryskibacteria bacterium RIFCSPLOWO2_01_FULL_43_17]